MYQFDNTTGAAIPTVAGSGSGATTVYTTAAGAQTIVTNNYNGTQASMACQAITVASETYNTIAGPVTVRVSITHSNVQDLVIKLFRTSPAGDNFTLMSRPQLGEGADDGTGGADAFPDISSSFPVTFSMASGTEAETMGTGLGFGGVVCEDNGICNYNPDNGASTLSENLADLNGDSKVGTWTLCVGDGYSGSFPGSTSNGTLTSWTLDLGSVGAPPDTSDTDCDDGTSSLDRTFTVSDAFTATSIGVGLTASHANRGDLRARLVAPDGTIYPLITQSADTDDNYDVLLSGNSDAGEPGTSPLDDGDIDPTTGPFYNHLVTVSGLSSISEGASGTWTLRLCDRNDNGVTGSFIQARLMLMNATSAGSVCTSRVSYDWGANGNGVGFTSATVGGITIVEDSTTDYGAGLNAGTYYNFATDIDSLGGHAGFYSLYMDADNTGGATDDAEAIGQVVSFRFEVGGTPYAVQDLEFQTLDSDQADGDFEDIVRVAATAPGGGFARFSRTPAPGVIVFQDAGDSIEADSACDNTDDCATENYKWDRPVLTVFAGYSGGDDIPTEPGDQVVGLSDFQFCGFDFGDAPNTYGTTIASNGARHVLGLRNLYLGANPPDGESEGAPNTAATLDDSTAIGVVDDEDGTESGLFPICPNDTTYSMSVAAVNGTGGTAYLVGYIDWNRDGDFNDTGERSATTNVGAGATNPTVSWTSVPANCGPNTNATAARFRISTNQANVESPIGPAPDGEVEDYQLAAGTLPVTLAFVDSQRDGADLVVRFATSTESANAGFRIWGLTAAGERYELGSIAAESPDSFVPRDYEIRVDGDGFEAIEIEDVALAGSNRLHGPFTVGHQAGERPVADTIDWSAVRAESGAVSPLDLFAERPARFLDDARIGKGPKTGSGQGLLLVREKGIHRVTYEELQAAGIDLTGVALSQIALVDEGVGVARHVESPSATFGPGAYLEFVAAPKLTLASPVDALELRVDAARAQGAKTLTAQPTLVATTMATEVRRDDKQYSYSSPTADPWYDQAVLAWGGQGTLSRTFDLPDLAGGTVTLKLFTWGYGDFPGAAPDHHVVVKVNGNQLASSRFDGFRAYEPSIDLTGQVSATGNVLEVILPGDNGQELDYLAYDGFEVTYPRLTIARNGRFEGSARSQYAIDGFAEGGGAVSVWQLDGKRAQRAAVTPRDGMVGAPSGGKVWAAQGDAILRPGLVATVPPAQTMSDAEYVIVTYPTLASSLDDLVALEESRGLTTEVVTVDRIYAAYSDHAPSADAVRKFLRASYMEGQLRYVLLVGADTTDPYDHLHLGSVSYVPTFYQPYAEYITYSPTDEAMVDFDGDAVGEVAIGRLPVRTPSEIQATVAKLYAWEQRIASGARSALLTAGASDTERVLSNLNESFSISLAAWASDLAQVDDLGTAAVRTAILSALGAGTPVVSYVGHSSMGQWDFTPLLRWQDVAGLSNATAPNLVTQWGCWNSYYVEPTIESLSARLLRQANGGAAGAIGAMTLTTDSAHRELGNLFFARVGGGAATVGDALLGAKRDLAAQGWGRDALLGMALLGDPAMSLPAPE